MEKIPVLVIAGPTASGKTALAVELAKEYNGEVISADSMQIYKNLDIGSAKPTEDEMDGIPHHMLDIKEAWESFSVADFVTLAREKIVDIINRGKLPILAGGTGLYVNSLIDDVDFSAEDKDEKIREELNELLKEKGIDYMAEMLREIDPVSFEKIHKNNTKRVIRAIEFFKVNGYPISRQVEETKMKESRYNPLLLIISRPRDYLYERIEKRVDIMLSSGLVDEVKNLMDMGITKKNQSMQGIGYKEVLDYLRGFSTYQEMVRILKRNTRRYAKRQITWFSRDDRAIKIDGDLSFEAKKKINGWLELGG